MLILRKILNSKITTIILLSVIISMLFMTTDVNCTTDMLAANTSVVELNVRPK